jgi:hypothetical protein
MVAIRNILCLAIVAALFEVAIWLLYTEWNWLMG